MDDFNRTLNSGRAFTSHTKGKKHKHSDIHLPQPLVRSSCSDCSPSHRYLAAAAAPLSGVSLFSVSLSFSLWVMYRQVTMQF